MVKKSILVLGAGRSSSALIAYLLDHAAKENWHVTVGDYVEQAAKEKVGDSVNGTGVQFDIDNRELSQQTVKSADVVISLLPASLHPNIAKLCLLFNKHLLTASYVSDEMQSFNEEALSKNLLFLNECGLDPGIDHMSALDVVDRIRDRGGKLMSFESFTGGLIAPETDPENPWRYKFTWNPRNVVMAGQGTARFIQEGQHKFIPYQQLFKRTTHITIPGYGDFEGYANRDSLKYINTYGLQGVKTMLRGTLRNDGFCAAWNVLAQLGCTDDSYQMESVSTMTHRDFINSFLPYDEVEMLESKLASRFSVKVEGPELAKLRWSGFFEKELVGLDSGTPAQILEHILNKKWKLQPQDRDMIVMWHRFKFELGGSKKEIQCYLVSKGEDSVHTAMAKTVGLPLAMAAKLLMQGKLSERGVVIPVRKTIYGPLLQELKSYGIELHESERTISE